MKKSIILPFLSAFLCFGVALTSCQKGDDNIIQSSDRNIVSIAVKEGTLPDVIVLGHFDEAGIKVVVTYSDGTSEEVAVNSTLLGESYAGVLQTVGTHQISLLFRGETINITVKIVPASYEVCFYAREGENAAYNLVKTQEVGYKEDATAPQIDLQVWDDLKHYTFADWDVDFSSVTKRLDVYAQYSDVNYYTVKFFDGNENIISSQKVDEGENAVEPSEEERHIARYDFVGWDRSYLNVTKNIDVYGIYQRATYAEVHYELTPAIEGNTVKYGLYPQTLVEDQAIIATLEQAEQHETGYYIYDEQFYAKVNMSAWPSTKQVKGIEKYTINNTYWFKVEPIEWTIVAQENNTYILQSSYAIDARQYHSDHDATRSIDGILVYPNNYKYSDIRNFLNNEFYENAFMLNDFYTRTAIVDNSPQTTWGSPEYNFYACENTEDKVWLIDAASEGCAKKGMSDYCQCIIDLNGDSEVSNHEWSRSPKTEDHKCVTYFVDHIANSGGCWTTDVYSIRPFIKIEL